MFFEFNKDKKQKVLQAIYVLFNSFCLSLAFSMLCYCITNLIVVLLKINFDPTSIKYMMIFIALFVIVFIAFTVIYFCTKTGVFINEKHMVVSIGYYDKIGFSYSTPIKIDDIVSIEYLEKFNYSEIKKDYKNYNFSWISVVTYLKDTPLAKVVLNDNRILLLPLDDINEFIKVYESYKNSQ